MHPVSFPLLAAALALMSVPALAARDTIPHLDIQGTCHEAQTVTDGSDNASSKQTYDACIQDERDARTQLSNKWSSFRPVDRRSCVEGSATPSPSYVELLTCLEMSDQVRSPASKSPDAIPNSPTPATRPMGSPSPRPPGSPTGGSRL